jgi:hypothetical protein
MLAGCKIETSSGRGWPPPASPAMGVIVDFVAGDTALHLRHCPPTGRRLFGAAVRCQSVADPSGSPRIPAGGRESRRCPTMQRGAC